MHAHALDGDLGAGGVEVLVFQVADVATVHGVSPLATKLLHVEVVGAHANFLVGVETHADVAMLNLRMILQVAHGLHYLCDASLVVGAKERGAIGHDKVLALVLQQLRELLGRGDDAGRELYVAPVVVIHDARLDIGAARVEGRVVVGDEAYRGRVFLGVAGQGGIDVTHVVHFHVLQPLALQLFLQVFGEDELLGGTGHGRRVFCRLRVKLCVIDESFYYIHISRKSLDYTIAKVVVFINKPNKYGLIIIKTTYLYYKAIAHGGGRKGLYGGTATRAR